MMLHVSKDWYLSGNHALPSAQNKVPEIDQVVIGENIKRTQNSCFKETQ
jgi:hypothetical protein